MTAGRGPGRPRNPDRLFVEAERGRERDTLADLERLPADADGADIARLMVGHVIRQLTLELEWLDELEGLLAG